MTAAPKQDDQDFDVRKLVEKPDLRVWDLAGKSRTLKIVRVIQGTVYSEKKKGDKGMPFLELAGPNGKWPKPFGLNATNLKAIGDMYGYRARDWVGKLITLFPSKTDVGKRKNVDCIRVKPVAPNANAPLDDAPEVPVDEEVLRKQEEAARELEQEGERS